jgi:hypothetical protein
LESFLPWAADRLDEVLKGNLLIMKSDITARLYFDGKEMDPVTFFPILQQGFMVETQIGINLQKLLTDQFSLTTDYVEDRIRTVFLDGKPVDDFNSTIIKQGSTLALSAAMPGLVGATFRKGGSLASFRNSITHDSTDDMIEIMAGYITIKLFNLLVKEIGPVFLKHGIFIGIEAANRFFNQQTKDFWASCRNAQIKTIDSLPDQLVNFNWQKLRGFVFLRLD